MKIQEIMSQEHLNEFALDNNQVEYTDEVAMQVLDAEAGPWSEPMTGEQLLAKYGITR